MGSILMSSVNGMIIIWLIGIVIPSINVAVRRLHDTGHTGWLCLFDFIPFIGRVILLVLWACDSQPGDNRYGPNPKGIDSPSS